MIKKTPYYKDDISFQLIYRSNAFPIKTVASCINKLFLKLKDPEYAI